MYRYSLCYAGMATSGDVITTQEIVVTKKSRDKSRSRKKTSDTVTKSGTENYTDFFTTTGKPRYIKKKQTQICPVIMRDD